LSIITKEDFAEWKANDVTKAFYDACKARVADGKDLLIYSAGIDQVQDNFYRGFIAAYEEMFEFRVEFSDET